MISFLWLFDSGLQVTGNKYEFYTIYVLQLFSEFKAIFCHFSPVVLFYCLQLDLKNCPLLTEISDTK